MNIKALLKQVPTTYYLVLVVGVGALGAWQANNYHQREVGKRELQIVQYEMANRDLRREADSLAKAYKPQTATAARTRIQWDTVKAGIDTAWLHDTIPVPVEVVRTVVITADSAIKSCTQALQTCDARVGVATRGWDGARAEIKVLKANYPSKLRPWLYGAAGGGLGYLVGRWLK